MNNTINKLLEIELEIMHIYELLIELDMSNEKNSVSYLNFSNTLYNLIIDEENIINSLSSDNINLLMNEENIITLLNNKVLSNKYINYSSVIKRIGIKINEFLSNKTSQKENIKKMTDIILSEEKDIFLSFIDEYINKTNSKDLLIFKYNHIFSLKTRDERKIIERLFMTDESLYLYSAMYADALNISRDKYVFYRDIFAINELDTFLKNVDIKSFDFSTPKKEIAASLFRTSFSIMSEETRNDSINNVIQNNDSLKKFINIILDGNIINMLEKDKERHKILSLQQK